VSKPESIDYLARHESFERWFQTPLGRALLADQRCLLDHELRRFTGARQLQVGISHRLPLATGTDFSQKIIVAPRWYPHIPDGVAICDADELPFPGDSMDLVLLHHTADFSQYPHEVLREAARVLRGEGTIALTGFNPVSLWGVVRLISRHCEGPWGGRFMLRNRMEDWLRLLGFSVGLSVTRFFCLPLQRSGRNHCHRAKPGVSGSRFLPGGAYYCILAKKRLYAGVPKRQPWRKSKVIALPGSGTVGASRGCSRQSVGTDETD
jgi:SAM-dependent methyltransferase